MTIVSADPFTYAFGLVIILLLSVILVIIGLKTRKTTKFIVIKTVLLWFIVVAAEGYSMLLLLQFLDLSLLPEYLATLISVYLNVLIWAIIGAILTWIFVAKSINNKNRSESI